MEKILFSDINARLNEDKIELTIKLDQQKQNCSSKTMMLEAQISQLQKELKSGSQTSQGNDI